jgi:hypothetical protein
VLFRAEVLDSIARGEVSTAVRRWRRPTVRAGGTLTTPIGVLAIDAVEVLEPAELTDRDARAAGASSAAALLAEPSLDRDGELHLIRFHLAGEDPRIDLRAQDQLEDTELGDVRRRLDRMDGRSANGPWTRSTLRLIASHEGVRAAELAEQLGRERAAFKADVRKLKALGLTESLDVGYRLSPRGRAVLDRLS